MGIPHKGGGHVGHAVLGGKGNIGNIRIGQEGQFQESPGHCHPFPGGDFPAVHHDGMDFLVRGGLDFQGQFSVVEQDGVPPLHFFRQTGVIHMGLFRRPFHILRGEDEFMAGHQGGLVPFEQPQTHFRAFGIGNIAHQAPCFLSASFSRFSRASHSLWEPWEKLNRARSIPERIISTSSSFCPWTAPGCR